MDHGNTSIFHIDGALSTEREKFNMSSQHFPLGFNSDKKWAYIQNLKLDDIKKGGNGQSLLIKTPFVWAIFETIEMLS